MPKRDNYVSLDSAVCDSLHRFFGTPKHAYRLLTLGHPTGVSFDHFMRLWGGLGAPAVYANIVRDSLQHWRKQLGGVTPELFRISEVDARAIASAADSEPDVELPQQTLDPELERLFALDRQRTEEKHRA